MNTPDEMRLLLPKRETKPLPSSLTEPGNAMYWRLHKRPKNCCCLYAEENFNFCKVHGPIKDAAIPAESVILDEETGKIELKAVSSKWRLHL